MEEITMDVVSRSNAWRKAIKPLMEIIGSVFGKEKKGVINAHIKSTLEIIMGKLPF